MSRTNKGKKAPGYEYWSRRPGSCKGGLSPGKVSKKRTHKTERQECRQATLDKEYLPLIG
jgi:hypothetical protein